MNMRQGRVICTCLRAFNINERLLIASSATNTINNTRRVMEGSKTLDLFSRHLDAAVLKIHELEQVRKTTVKCQKATYHE